MRLDKILAQSGLGSRSEVRQFIRSGQITINGLTVRDPGYSEENLEQQTICLAGNPVLYHRHKHLMMNKPAGLITAHQDNRHETIMALVPEIWINRGISPVGRLDRDTTGLLLLTTDGVLNHRLTSPRWEIWKTYQIVFSGEPLQECDVTRFKTGLTLSPAEQFRPARLTIIDHQSAELSIQEGKFHQVKRMFRAINRTVIQLHRIRIGPLRLDDSLEEGQIRELTDSEISALYEQVQLTGQD